MPERIPDIHIRPDVESVVESVAERFAELADRHRDAFRVALAGGNTPRRLYQRLSESPYGRHVPWPELHVFFGDERCVPADHPDSNFGMARDQLLSKVSIPADQCHPMPADIDHLWRGVGDYTERLRRHLPADEDHVPIFDLVLLGLGDDGHTASLFPRTCILKESRPVAAVYVPRLGSWRMSLTLPVINRARHVVFLVTGRDKAAAVGRAFGKSLGEPPPAGLVHPAGTLEVFLDRAAATVIATAAPDAHGTG